MLERFKQFRVWLNTSISVKIGLISLLAISVPLTVYQVTQMQTFTQHAQEISPPFPPDDISPTNDQTASLTQTPSDTLTPTTDENTNQTESTPTPLPTDTLFPTQIASPTETLVEPSPIFSKQNLSVPTPLVPTQPITQSSCLPLVAPTGLTPTGRVIVSSQGDTYTLKWNAVTNATAYALRVNDLKNLWPDSCDKVAKDDICIDTIKDTSFSYTFKPGHTYSWWVQARNSCNDWGKATVTSVTALPIKPVNKSENFLQVLLGLFKNIGV